MKKGMVDITLFLIIVTLTTVGLIMIYSASSIWAQFKFNDAFKFVKAQVLFLIVGYVAMYLVSNIDYTWYKNKANIIIGVCFILLILVLIPGLGIVRGGSRSWFGIGSFGVQPSEFMKLGLIIFISKYLVNSQKQIKSFFKGSLPIMMVIILGFGLIMLQPDFGTGMVIVASCFTLIFSSGAPYKFFLNLGFLGLGGIIALIISAPYRLARITSYLNPWSDPLGSGFQIIQSLYAIGPGGLLGYGLGGSIQKHFYLPEPQTDFIFSIISEELGYLGVVFIILLFILLFYRSYKIAMKCEDLFGKYLVFGLVTQITIQAALNLMVVSGILPVTGVTLPFLSYGGSSLIITMVSIGIILNVSRHVN